MQMCASELSANAIILLVLVPNVVTWMVSQLGKSKVIQFIDIVLFTSCLIIKSKDKLTPRVRRILDLQAKSEAAKQGKWLLVNMQSTTEFASYMVRMHCIFANADYFSVGTSENYDKST